MSWGKLIGTVGGFLIGGPAGAAIGGSVGGAVDEATGGGEAGAAKDAAAIANAAAERDLALRTRIYEEGVARQQPFYEAGVNALGQLRNQYTNMPAAFTGQVQLGQDPGYAFRLAEGQKALDRQAAARGGLISGGALKAAQRYGQEMGSQEYGNAYSRALTAYNADVARETTGYNRLASLAGYGPIAATSLNAAGQNYATGAGNIMSGQGETSANALLAGQRARSSSYGQVGSALGRYLNPSANYNYGAFGGGSGTFGEGEY
jgi:hypothetical protein